MVSLRTELTCRELVGFILAWLDGDLPPAERASFERHLAECDDCVAYLRSYEATLRLGRSARDASDDPVPDAVPEPLVAAILAARPRPLG